MLLWFVVQSLQGEPVSLQRYIWRNNLAKECSLQSVKFQHEHCESCEHGSSSIHSSGKIQAIYTSKQWKQVFVVFQYPLVRVHFWLECLSNGRTEPQSKVGNSGQGEDLSKGMDVQLSCSLRSHTSYDEKISSICGVHFRPAPPETHA
jgi:hypothetical protein